MRLTTGLMIMRAGIEPRLPCWDCGTRQSWTSYVDREQNAGYVDWTWQCGGCGSLASLSRKHIQARYTEWKRENETHGKG